MSAKIAALGLSLLAGVYSIRPASGLGVALKRAFILKLGSKPSSVMFVPEQRSTLCRMLASCWVFHAIHTFIAGTDWPSLLPLAMCKDTWFSAYKVLQLLAQDQLLSSRHSL